MSISTFFRPAVANNFSTYSPSRQVDVVAAEIGVTTDKILKLDSGENIWIPQSVFSDIQIRQNFATYPDSMATGIRTAISEDIGVPVEWVTIGNGSDELIDLTCRLFLESGKVLVDFTPTFPMFSFFGKLCGATIVNVPRLVNFELDIEKAKKALTTSTLAFLANPNNPTGTLISREVIVELLQVGTPLVVDEAYFEFSGETVVDLLSEFENLIVIRTFSKWAGIAGLRIGYMIANSVVIDRIDVIRAPYNVNKVAQAVAIEVLKQKPILLETVKDLIASREWFFKRMQGVSGMNVIPSKASCITIFFTRISADEVTLRLKQKGILVKSLAGVGFPNAIRLSIAPQKDMARVVNALQEII